MADSKNDTSRQSGKANQDAEALRTERQQAEAAGDTNRVAEIDEQLRQADHR